MEGWDRSYCDALGSAASISALVSFVVIGLMLSGVVFWLYVVVRLILFGVS
jgi:hypothetical protein